MQRKIRKFRIFSYARLSVITYTLLLISITLIFSKISLSDEIIQDKDGIYFFMKDDGTFEKLPKPKPGHKYIIKKKSVTKKKEKAFKKPERKARRRTDTGFR